MVDKPDVEALVKKLMAGKSVEENLAMVEALMNQHVPSMLEELQRIEAPTLLAVPSEVRGFRVRLDLHGARPPVWRRLELPGDLTLPRLHDVVQAAMGWTNSHLHRFRTDQDPRAPYFVTHGDVEEGDEGTLEDDVRLDQLLAAAGDELWYDYDFGDGWEHRLRVEEVLEEPPSTPRCIAGRMACPPEDCGGLGGYEELAAWARGGYDADDPPEPFDSAADAHEWLPLDWHPDHFDVAETNDALAVALAEPVAVTDELADLVERLEGRGDRRLRERLGSPFSHAPTDVTEDEAARLTASYRSLLDVVGDGVTLTGAGYLPPAAVEQVAQHTGITQWWIGKANREDLTPPVAILRASARALGLVSVRKGRLRLSAAATRAGQDPRALLDHIVGRLPLGTRDHERQSGWMALVVAGSGVPAEQWDEEISELMHALGWVSGDDRVSPPPAHSPTLDVLEQLAGASTARRRRLRGVDLAVSAAARSAFRR